jgi:hypothetical protein
VSVYGYLTPSSTSNYSTGVQAVAYSPSVLTNGRTYGISAYAGNASSGYNYAVYGTLEGSSNGAAIYGVVPGYGDVNTGGMYAGYFLGNVYVNGHVGVNTTPNSSFDIVTLNAIQAPAFTVTSDARLKSNVQNVKGALSTVSSLQGVTYNLLSNTLPTVTNGAQTKNAVPDTGKVHDYSPIPDSLLYKKLRLGFLAQDVQKILPNVVYTDQNGVLSVDYISIIPLLVESIKELTARVKSDSADIKALTRKFKSDSLSIVNLNNYLGSLTTQLAQLTAQLNQCCSKTTTKVMSESDQIPISTPVENVTKTMVESDIATLSQNAPNPFSQNTTIGYYLPASVKNAVIYVYNLQGIQISSIQVNDRGNGSVVIYGNSLPSGMYVYTLITDGKVVDTKSMILTK